MFSNIELVDLKEFIREFLKQPEIIGYKEKVKIYFHSQNNIPKVSLDKRGMGIVLTKLVANAVEHARGRAGAICVDILLRNTKRFVEIIISNPGKLPNPPESVFEPFFTTAPDAIGLGLTAAKSIINTFHRDASIEARQKDTLVEFVISLPI